MRIKMRGAWIFLTIIFFTPLLSSAQIAITEIMYDLEGSDAGREWVEITNTGSGSVDLSSWKFYEEEINHGLTLYQGNEELSAQESAIIVSNPEKFLIDWPDFEGTIFDSSFSLKNTGESLTIRDQNLANIDTVLYDPMWGGEGNGNSINKSSNSWIELKPSPGEYSSEGNIREEVVSGESDSSSEKYSPPVNFPIGNISTDIIGEEVVLVGAGTEFRAESLGVKGEKLENARHLWNFGDGRIREGEKVIHSYIYPGEYTIFLDVSSEDFSANDVFYVEVVPSKLFISETNRDFIKITNPDSRDINISFWMLQAGVEFFSFPRNTFIRRNGAITFSNNITDLNGSLKPVKLLYPNGNVAYEFDIESSKKITKVKSITPANRVVVPIISVKSNLDATASIQGASSISIHNKDLDEKSEKTLIQSDREPRSLTRWLLVILGLGLLGGLSVFAVKEKNSDIVEEYRIIE